MERNRVIFDSNIFIALYFKEDSLHDEAVFLVESLSEVEVLVPYCVIQEVATILTYRFGKRVADKFIKDVVTAENCVLIDNNIYEEVDFFMKFDKKLSFTDIALVLLAKKYGAELLTFDKQLRGLYKGK